MRSVIAAALLVPAFLGANYGQHGGRAAENKAGPKLTISCAARLQVIEEAHKDADALKEPRSRAELYAAIATAQAKAGDQASARRSFERAIQAADAVEDLSSRAATLADVAEAQVESDDRTAARRPCAMPPRSSRRSPTSTGATDRARLWLGRSRTPATSVPRSGWSAVCRTGSTFPSPRPWPACWRDSGVRAGPRSRRAHPPCSGRPPSMNRPSSAMPAGIRRGARRCRRDRGNSRS